LKRSPVLSEVPLKWQPFLKKNHLRCHKIGMIPAKADPDEQAAYLYEVIQPRLEEAQKG